MKNKLHTDNRVESPKEKKVNKTVEFIFDERKNFVIIGLTGRTGAGCSTVSELLSRTFEELIPPEPQNNCFQNNEERKYKILYNYAHKNWEQFVMIEMRNIISSFLLEKKYEDVMNYLKVHYEKNFDDIQQSFDNEFRKMFKELHITRIMQQQKIQQNEDYLKADEVYKFFFASLSIFTVELKSKLDAVDKSIYTSFFQSIANNIRASGDVFIEKYNQEKMYLMPQRTNTLIKILRKRNLEKRGRVLVVIDAIRNPYEAIFFKDRYSSFYLFAVNTEEEERTRRLFEKGLNKQQIKSLDKIEYPEKLSKDKKIWSQNIQACIELSDVYINNVNDSSRRYNKLKQILIKYITLIIHPGLVTPTHEERSMQIAYNAKMNSGCLSRHVGAVVTDEDYSIKSVGWNTTPECQIPCNLRMLEHLVNNSDKEAFSFYEITDEEFSKKSDKIYKEIQRTDFKGRDYQYCFKDLYNSLESQKGKKNQVHTRSMHAEENAFLQISKNGGIGVKGGYLFTTASPCELCAKKAYQLGIKKIYYIDLYPGISSDHILKSGARNPEMILFNGAIGRGYVQLYTQIIPYKDELDMFFW